MKSIYLIISKDDYLIKQKVLEIINTYESTEEMLEMYDLDEGNVDELLGELTTISVFDDYRLFWVKNTTALTKKSLLPDNSLDKIIKYIASPVESSILIFSSTDYYPNSVLATELRKYATVIEADNTYTTKEEFAKEFCKKEEINITDAALANLLTKVDDYQGLENELIKLKYYAMGSLIDNDVVENVAVKNIDSKIYEITNAILSHDKATALNILNELLEANETPSRIFNNILGKILEILYVKKMLDKKMSKEEIAENFNVSPGRAYYMIKNANDISSATLERYINDLAELNYQARSGNMDEKTGLELFILKS